VKNREITKASLKRVKELVAGVENMTGKEYQEILDSMVKFHRYSFYNQMILMFHRCSQVAGYKRWQELGRSVKKGSKAVWILAPAYYKKKVTVKNEEGQEEEEEVRKLYFRSVPVFDISDTEGEEIERGLTTRSRVSFPEAKEAAEKLGLSVTLKPLEIIRGGYIKEKAITLNSNLNDTEHVGTLIHELSHWLLNHTNNKNGELPEEVEEQQAETATYLACRILGVERKSEFYLKGWALSQNIVKDFQTLDKVAKEIIGAINNKGGDIPPPKGVKKVDNFEATGIAEGFIECKDEKKAIAAWQHLIDTGLAWSLQGFFGRTASRLIEAGICHR